MIILFEGARFVRRAGRRPAKLYLDNSHKLLTKWVSRSYSVKKLDTSVYKIFTVIVFRAIKFGHPHLGFLNLYMQREREQVREHLEQRTVVR